MSIPGPDVFGIIQGFWKSRMAWTFSHMGLADHLYEKPQTAEELAAKVKAHLPYLYRLLRGLGDFGIVIEDPITKRFSLGPVGNMLRKDDPNSLKYTLESECGYVHYEAWKSLEQCVISGKSAISCAFDGKEFWEVMEEHNEAADTFHKHMTNITSETIPQALTFDFSPFKTIVDIGGGVGSLLAAILKATPSSNGIVFDAPSVVKDGKFASDRLKYVGGNFFESVPPGGDLYVLKHVFHDWDDEHCLKILHNIRKEIPNHGKILAIDMILPEYPLSKYVDNLMMTLLYGKERTEEEWRDLFHKGGFRLEKIHRQPTVCLFEAVPV